MNIISNNISKNAIFSVKRGALNGFIPNLSLLSNSYGDIGFSIKSQRELPLTPPTSSRGKKKHDILFFEKEDTLKFQESIVMNTMTTRFTELSVFYFLTTFGTGKLYKPFFMLSFIKDTLHLC